MFSSAASTPAISLSITAAAATTRNSSSLYPLLPLTSTSRRRTITRIKLRRRFSAGATAAETTAAAGDSLQETAKETVSSALSSAVPSVVDVDDPGSSVIAALFLVAFIGLSILTIGVIYLAVTDFLQKREREKFEKEEAAKKKSGKKKKVKVRAGPKGFGQKFVEAEDEDY